MTNDCELAREAVVARSFLQRAIGLLGYASLPQGQAMMFHSVNSIHTWFMRFPIDVVFLKEGVVVKSVAALRPFRMAWESGADAVIELPSGTIARTGTKQGHQIRWQGVAP